MRPEQFQEYCDDIMDPSLVVWGGQLEISALAALLQRRIVVYSGTSTPIEMGENTCADKAATPIRISFHRYYLGLGNHYNSVASST